MCVPVTVTPYATSRNAIARCCGNPVVTEQNSCPRGERTCTFTVTQPLCIEVSIEFGADISTGDASVTLEDVTGIVPAETGLLLKGAANTYYIKD